MPRAAHAQTVPTLQVEDVSASENADSLEFVVSLGAGETSTRTVTVDYATADGTAMAGNDYTETRGTLTLEPGATSGVVSVPVVNDKAAERDETFTLTLSNPTNAALPGGADSVSATGEIIDNERPRVSIALRQAEVFEGQPAVLDLVRTGSADDRILFPFRVRITDLDGNWIRGVLYDEWTQRFVSPNVLIPAGERDVTWSWHPEDGVGQDYQISIELYRSSNVYNFGIEGGPFTITVRQRPVHQSLEISDPDDELPAVTIAAGGGGVPTVAEAEDAAFTLTRTGDTSEALTVRVYTEEPRHPGWTPDDAGNPSAAFHPVTFTAGSATATLTVGLDDDGVTEDADWLEAWISPPAGSGYRKGDPHRAAVNIIDEAVDHDSLSELLEVGIVAVTTSLDEGGMIRVDTVRPHFPDDGRAYPPVSVKVRVSQDGSVVAQDWVGVIASVHPWYAYGGVNRLRIPTLTDDGDEPDTTATFTLLESPSYRIDPDNASVSVVVRDLDPAPVLEIADTTATRGADKIVFSVSFADDVPSLQAVTFDYFTSDGTAKSGKHYTGTSGTLTIPPGELGAVVEVPLLSNPDASGELDFNLTISDPSNAGLAGGEDRVQATGRINHRPTVTIRALQSEVMEGDSAVFELTRTGAVNSELTVSVDTYEPNSPNATHSSNPTDMDHDVTFEAGSSTATLSATASVDDKDEAADSDPLRAEIVEPNHARYKPGDPRWVEISIRDSIPAVTVTAGRPTVIEGENGSGKSVDATFILTRTDDASEELTVTVSVYDPQWMRCSDHVVWYSDSWVCGSGAIFEQAVTFAAGSSTATLSVQIPDDRRAVPNGSALTVTVVDKNGYRLGKPDSARVTLDDNDHASVLELSASHDEIVEGEAETLTFTVTRSSGVAGYREHFPWSLSNTGAGSPDESGVFEMALGVAQFTKTIELPGDNDKADRDRSYTFSIDRLAGHLGLLELGLEQREYFTVQGPRSITVPVRDAGGPRVTIEADQTGITEGATAAFTLTRPGDASDVLAVNIAVEDPGHFMRGNHTWSDPQPPSTVEFAAGSATATLRLPTRDDWRDIADDRLTVTIEPGDDDDYRPAGPSSASVTVQDNDTKPGIVLSVNNETLTEGETVVFTLTRTTDFTHPLTVPLLIGRQGEQQERSFAIPAGQREATIQYGTGDDDLDEADVVYAAEFSTVSDNDYWTARAPYSVSATVVDDDLPRVRVEADRAVVSEGEVAVFRLTREGQNDADLEIDVRVSQTGTATSEEYLGERTFTIFAGVDWQFPAYYLPSLDGYEPDDSITVEILDSDGYVTDPDRASSTITVRDTDPEPTLQLRRRGDRPEDPSVAEGVGAVEIEVFYDGPASRKEATVDYYTLSATASEGEDYAAAAGTLAIPGGETSGVISVAVVQDSVPEHDETFFLVLTNPHNARLQDGAGGLGAHIIIRDDEPRVSIEAGAGEVTEGEPVVFNLTRTGDLTKELFVRLSVVAERRGTEANRLLPLTSATFPAGESTVQLSYDTDDDDVDEAPVVITAIVQDVAAFDRASTYLPFSYVATVTVLDDDLPTLAIEADSPTRLFSRDVNFTLTREGDLSIPLTVDLDITQGGESDKGSLPSGVPFATGPSSVTFAEGSSTARLTLTTTSTPLVEVGPNQHENYPMNSGWVNAAIADSDAYTSGDPAAAHVLLFKNRHGFPRVHVDDADTVTEGGDLVFTLHRSSGFETRLTVWVRLSAKGAPHPSPRWREVTFELGSDTATLTVPTEDNEINDGNTRYTASLILPQPVLHTQELGYFIDYTVEFDLPRVGYGWVRDDDIPTVWVTPETGQHLEDPEGGGPVFTFHRDSYTSNWTEVYVAVRVLRRWPPPLEDYLYIGSRRPASGNGRFLPSGESSYEYKFSPRFVGPLGGESAVSIVPNYCGEDVLGDCGYLPQYHIGTPSSGVIQVYNRFAGIRVEAVEAEVQEGDAATFTLTRFGGTPVSNQHPLTVWVEVTQDGEYIEGVPPQTVKFKGWPEVATEDSDKTITVSVPTTDDDVDESHGAITLRVLPPERIDVDEPSSYEAGLHEKLIPFETATVRVNDNDYDPPPISISDARAGEADGTMEFTVSAAPSEREMSVEWNTVAETGVNVATADADYDTAGGTVTFAVGDTSKTITVPVLNDELNENDETFKVVLSEPTDAILGDSTGTGTIEDDDEGTVVTIHPQRPNRETVEGQTANFILQRVGATGTTLNIRLDISQEGDFLDRVSSSVSQEIHAGDTEAPLRLPTVDDDQVEANGSVTATIQPGDGHSYSPGVPATATVNIRDNDRTLSVSGAEAGEGAGEMTFTVTLSAEADEEVRVTARTSPGTATSSGDITETSLGKDYQRRTDELVFEPGETEKSFTVTLVDDDIDEPAEEFTVRLSRPSSNVWLPDDNATATGKILDNDDPMLAQIFRHGRRVPENQSGAVRFSVELTHDDTIASERVMRLFWQVTAGTATEDEDYVKPYAKAADRGRIDIPVGHLTATIEVDLIDDDLLEERLEDFTVELVEGGNLALPETDRGKAIQVSILDNEQLLAAVTPVADSVTEGHDAVFEVWLPGGETTQPTVFGYTVAGTATADIDYTAPDGTLAIPAGHDIGTITITTLEDPDSDPDETLTVTLTSGKSGGRDARIPAPTATVTILDTSMSTNTITASVAPAAADEGGRLSFALTLSMAGDSDVTVDWETADDPQADAAATADIDYRRGSGTLTVPAGDTSATIAVQSRDDTLAAEGDETFRVNLTGGRIGAGQDAEDLPLGVSSAVGTIRDNDIAPTQVTLTATPGQVSEGAGATVLTVTATLDGQHSLAHDTPVQLAVEEVSATADEDYKATTARLTIPAGALSHAATLTLAPVDDDLAEGDETVSIAGTAGTADGLTVVPAEVTIADNDDPPTGVTLTLEPEIVGEGAGVTELKVTATLTGGDSRTGDTQVTLSVEGVSLTLDNGDGTITTTNAATTDDFSADGTTVTIPAGRVSGSATVTLTPVDDTIAEGDETAQVVGAADGLDVTAARLTIRDNDRASTRIALSVSPAEVDEDGGRVSLTVTATLQGGGARTSGTDVSLTVHGVTATAGDDFTAQEGATLTIPAGQMSGTATLALTPVDDALAEDAEQLAVRGSNTAPGLPVIGDRITLTDNDAQPTMITLSLDKDTVEEDGGAQRLTVTARLEGSSRRTVDTPVALRMAGVTATEYDFSAQPGALTIEAGGSEGTATVVLTPTNDYIDEEDETLEVRGSTPEPGLQVSGRQVTIKDDDTAGVSVSPTALPVDEGQDSSYRVVLDTRPAGDVTVAVSGHSGTDVSVSPESLTFTAADWSNPRSVTVAAADDDDAAADASVTLAHTVTAAAGSGYERVSADDVVVTIVEKDVSVLSVSDARVAEDGGSAVFEVGITAAAGVEVTVDYTTSDVTAVAGEDYAETSGTLTFAAGSTTAQRVSVPVIDDSADEAEEEAFTLTLSGAVGASLAGGGSTLSAVGTIVDDDDPQVTVSFEESSYSVAEGASVTVTVVLSAAPERQVVVPVTHTAQGDTTAADYSVPSTSVTFNIDQTTATFTFTAAADDIDDDGDSVALGFGDLPERVSAGAASTVSITDDDVAGLTLSPVSVSVTEGGAASSYTAVLDSQPTSSVTVTITGAGTDVTLDVSSLVFTAGNWDDAQTVTVTAVDDAIDENTETVTLTNTTSGGGYGTHSADVEVTIGDNDAAGLTLSPVSVSVTEGGAGDSYTVVLDSQPTADVTVTVSGATGDVRLDTTSMTFTAGDWDTAQTVTVAADDDTVDDDGESVTLVHTASGGGYDDLAESLTVTITDNDDPQVTVSFEESSYSVAEGASVTVTVVLSAEPERRVVVPLTHTAQGDTTAADYSTPPTSVTFEAGDTSKTFTFDRRGRRHR